MKQEKTATVSLAALAVTGGERTIWAMRGWIGVKKSGFASEKDFAIKKGAKPYRRKEDI